MCRLTACSSSPNNWRLKQAAEWLVKACQQWPRLSNIRIGHNVYTRGASFCYWQTWHCWYVVCVVASMVLSGEGEVLCEVSGYYLSCWCFSLRRILSGGWPGVAGGTAACILGGSERRGIGLVRVFGRGQRIVLMMLLTSSSNSHRCLAGFRDSVAAIIDLGRSIVVLPRFTTILPEGFNCH